MNTYTHHKTAANASASAATFMARLARHRRVWQRGLTLQGLLRLAGWAIAGLALYGLFDYFIPVAAPLRRWINITGGIVLVILAGHSFLRIARLTLHDTACRLDRRCHDRRRSNQTACELLQTESASKGLYAYLLGRSVTEAGGKLEQRPLSLSLPSDTLRRQARVFGLQGAILLALIALNPLAGRIILMRILHPAQDAPPYSRYAFHVEPEQARVTYGGSLELRTRITGAPLQAPVWLLTRDAARTHRTACFQETDHHFSQRLDHVVAPLEFAFATGRARSDWYPIKLLLQPRVADATVVITPPTYSQRAPRQFEAGSQVLQGLRGAHITLTLTSNRPLLDGTATIQPRDTPEAEQIITGKRIDTHVMRFDWILGETADVDVDLRDIQGTTSAAPFRLQQQRIPDETPTVTLHEPQAFSLATPGARLALKGEARDDIGLRQVELIKALVGYRDRMQVIGPEQPVTQYSIQQELDLAALGVQPGDTLEFYAEAIDTRPGLANLAASPIARVQIISHAEYAEMLRMQSTLREFKQRYRTVEDSMSQLRDALETLKAPELDNKQTALDHAVQRAEAAEQTLSQLSNDFILYDMEKTFFEDLQAIHKTVSQAHKELAATSTANPRLAALARHWHREISPAVQTVNKHREQAQVAVDIAELMDAAVRFRQLVQRQEALVRSMERYENETGGMDNSRLRALGNRQADIARDLADVLSTIERTAPLLKGDAAPFAETAKLFRQQVLAADPETPMQAAVKAATNSDGRSARHQSVLALERLQQTSKQCEGDGGFGGMCQGQAPPEFGNEDLQNTLEQMLAAMMQRMLGRQGGGEGPTPTQGIGGSGIGLGGDRSDGYWMSGHTPLSIPVSGPPRTRFQAPSQGTTGETGTGGKAGRPAVNVDTATRDDAATGDIDSRTMPLENIPNQYREAVKRYFSTME